MNWKKQTNKKKQTRAKQILLLTNQCKLSVFDKEHAKSRDSSEFLKVSLQANKEGTISKKRKDFFPIQAYRDIEVFKFDFCLHLV